MVSQIHSARAVLGIALISAICGCDEPTEIIQDEDLGVEISNEFTYSSDRDDFTNSFVSQAVTNRRVMDDAYLRISLSCDRSDGQYGHSTLIAGSSAYDDNGRNLISQLNRIALKSNQHSNPIDVAWPRSDYESGYGVRINRDDIAYSKTLGDLKFNFLMPFTRGSLVGVTNVDLRTYISFGLDEKGFDVRLDLSDPAISRVISDCNEPEDNPS